MWDPKDYWGEKGRPFEPWDRSIFALGPRSEFERARVVPGQDPDDSFDNLITQAIDLTEAGERVEAMKILMDVCHADRHYLDAHWHFA